MSDEVQTPPVIDLDALAQPIAGENPSGENQRYSGLYDEIAEARRADDAVALGDWQTDLKVADYRRVIELAVPALTNSTKDLQIGVWLVEALIKQHAFAGLRDGLRMLVIFHENFWETLHPEIDEGDMEGRANALSWLDGQGSFILQSVPFTGNAGYSLLDLADSKVFDIPENLDSLDSQEAERFRKLREQAERERRVTAEMWRREWETSRRGPVEEKFRLFEESRQAFKDLIRVVDEKFDRNQVPAFTNLNRTLDEIESNLKRLLEEKRREEPDEIEETAEETTETAADGTVTVRTGGGGPIQDRRDALKRLGEIAAFFQRTEPHSPISYLIQRAVKWGNMPLESWLQDVIKDDSIIFQIRQTLGFNTETPDSSGE